MLFVVAVRGIWKHAAIIKGKLDEIGSMLKHSPPRSFKCLVQEIVLSGFKCQV
jgi:hypothetical protein